MSSAVLYPVLGAMVFALGLVGVLNRPHLLVKVLSANLAATGVALVLVGAGAPDGPGTDPVPQAMVLTGIVVMVSATAVALAIVARLYWLDPGGVEGSD